MEIDLIWVGAGLAAMGYFIGEGLKNIGNPKNSTDNILIKEKDLHFHLGISKEEVKDLLSKYPNAPKMELNGTTYYPYQQFMDWLSSENIFKA